MFHKKYFIPTKNFIHFRMFPYFKDLFIKNKKLKKKIIRHNKEK